MASRRAESWYLYELGWGRWEKVCPGSYVKAERNGGTRHLFGGYGTVLSEEINRVGPSVYEYWKQDVAEPTLSV